MILAISFFILLTVSAYDVENFTTGNNKFTADAYRAVPHNSSKNILISPLSAGIVLALLQSGANGETGSEIRRAVCLPKTDDSTKSAVKSILPSLKDGKHFLLLTANRIYVDKKFHISPKFQHMAHNIYQASVDNIDFGKNDVATTTINDWVAKQTQNKIKNLLDSRTLGSSAALVLINALYFKGRWSDMFRHQNTKQAHFFTTPNNSFQVDTMFNHDVRLNYKKDQKLQARFVELPFDGRDASIVIVLPNKINGVVNLENHLHEVFTPHDFLRAKIDLSLPKFKFEDTIDFVDVLRKLGVRKAFDPIQANFTQIAERQLNLAVDKILQKGFISIDETGAEAAAATGVEMKVMAAPSMFEKAIEFFVDHPFIFYIKIKDLILFAGKVVDPRKK